MSGRAVLWSFAGLAAVAALALLVPHPAEASHFRGGTIYAMPGDPDPLNITFEGRISFRTSYTVWACTPGSPASTIFSGTIFVTDSTGALQGSASFDLGVMACNAAQDWFQGKLIDPSTGLEGVPFHLTAPLDPYGLPWHYEWSSGARLGMSGGNEHINNPDANWRLEGLIDLSGSPDQPPRPFVPPIVQCRTSGLCSIPITHLDADDDPVSLRFSTGCEATANGAVVCTPSSTGYTFYQPGPCAGACGPALASSVSSVTHTLNWDTTGAGLSSCCRTYYSTQVMLNDTRIHVPMDFLIRLVDGTPPKWVSPPSPCDQTLSVIQGRRVLFTLEAKSDNASRVVEIVPLEYPAGSSTVVGAPGNPTWANFTWSTTSSTPIGDYLAVFLAQDDDGLSAPTCIVRIRVLLPPQPDFSWVFTETAPDDLTYDPVQFTDETLYIPEFMGATRGWSWAFNDPSNAEVGTTKDPSHEYDDNGVRTACMELTVILTDPTDPWRATVCHDVTVHNRAPIPNVRPAGVGMATINLADIGGDMDGIVVQRAWDFGDGLTGTGNPVSHTYSQEAVYFVCVTDTDDDGATGTTCAQVRVTLPKPRLDSDSDGVADDADACPDIPDRTQSDADQDGIGDACDLDPNVPDPYARVDPARLDPAADDDRDGVANAADDCPRVANRDQADLDQDGQGDLCDADLDGDGMTNAALTRGALLDNCPTVPNAGQQDTDGDGVGDACAGAAGAALGTKAGLQPRSAAGGDTRALAGQETGATTGLAFGTVATIAGAVLVVALLGTATAAWAIRRWR